MGARGLMTIGVPAAVMAATVGVGSPALAQAPQPVIVREAVQDRFVDRLEALGTLRAVLDDARVRAHVASGLARLKAAGGGSSRYAARARLMEAPPSVDAGEINDKGYINQRAVLDNRPGEIAALEGDDPAQFIEPE